MPLGPGTRLGPYEVVAALGAGGMGEVYRAHDTKLNRDVALKILPADFALDPDRRARFTREAQLLASLNHPNIAAIYGFEDSGDTHALVLELVEGETLADRIARGPIPFDEALAIARQICEALEAAHEHGVIHRDLKPANIKVRPDGAVKVLDFGLAKLNDSNVSNAPNVPNALSMSPTITSPALMTGMGVQLGTAAYMAPEQARGRAVDKRADIWAFGCVLFEMLASARPFAGDEVTDVIIAALSKEPDWAKLPASTPRRVRELLERCLRKDPRERLRDIGDARNQLSEPNVLDMSPASGATAIGTRGHWRWALACVALIAIGAAVGGAAVWYRLTSRPAHVARVAITPQGATALTIGGADPDIAISPDGTRLVYVGGNGTELFIRSLDRLESRRIEIAGGAGAPHNPVFSPDGLSVAFFDGLTALKQVSVDGGPADTICRIAAATEGLAWGADGTIMFATIASRSLFRVAANGGQPEELLIPEGQSPDVFYGYPEVLPGGRALLFSMLSSSTGTGRLAAFDLATRTVKVLLNQATNAHFFPTGHLVYLDGKTLRAARFDANSLSIIGAPIALSDQPFAPQFYVADLSVSANGTLAYVPSGTTVAGRSFVWVDRSGVEEPLGTPVKPYVYPRVSPDGKRIAFDVRDQESDVWIWDIARRTLSRFTFSPAYDGYPVWTHDGRELIFTSSRSGANGVFRQASDGSGEAKKLFAARDNYFSYGVSPDGQRIIVREDSPTTGQDLIELHVGNSETRAEPLIRTAANELNAEISPDGRWLAYESNESGEPQVYVRAFPDRGGAKWQVSSGSGTRPLWSRDGKELFFIDHGGAIMGVKVEHETADSFNPGAPVKIVDAGYFIGGSFYVGRTYDISPDGRRFLMMKLDSSTPSSIVLVFNWFDELTRLLPPN